MSSVEKQYKNTKIVQTLLSSKQRGLAKQAYKGGQASSAHAVIQQHRDQRFQSRLTLRCRSLYKKRSILPTPAIAGVFVLPVAAAVALVVCVLAIYFWRGWSRCLCRCFYSCSQTSCPVYHRSQTQSTASAVSAAQAASSIRAGHQRPVSTAPAYCG